MSDVLLSTVRPDPGRSPNGRSKKSGTIAAWRTNKSLKIVKTTRGSDRTVRSLPRLGQVVDGKACGKILRREAHLRALKGIPYTYVIRSARHSYEVRLTPRLNRNGRIIGVAGVLTNRDGLLATAGTMGATHVLKKIAASRRRKSFDSARRLLDLARAVAETAKINARVREHRAAEQEQRALEAQLQAEARERRSRFLADASAILDTSFNLRETIDRLAKLILQRYADWIILHLQSGGKFRRFALCHRDAEKQKLLEGAFSKHAEEEEEEEGLVILDHQAFFEGRHQGPLNLFTSATPQDRLRLAPGRVRLKTLRKISVQSIIQAPVRSHGRAIGVLTVGSDDPGHLYDLADFQMFQSLAYLIGLAHESSVLFEDAQQEIGRRKEAEERLRAFNAELERRVLERTSLLEEATREANSFAYTVAHDLRAPLRAITGFCQALREDYSSGIDATGQDYVDRIVGGARRMDDLIRDLLDYARVNRAEIKRGPVSLDEVLDAVLESMTAELRDRKASVRRKSPLGRATAHEPMLHQVLTNPISNGIKFVAPGTPPEISIRSEHQDGRVRLLFQDNGIGIAPEHQGRIFGIFERLNRTEEYPGTGIGLAIVRRAVERLGGAVGVESTPGHGSTFWIELPTA